MRYGFFSVACLLSCDTIEAIAGGGFRMLGSEPRAPIFGVAHRRQRIRGRPTRLNGPNASETSAPCAAISLRRDST